MADLKTVLTETLAKHGVVSYEETPGGNVIECECGWFYTSADHAKHQAEMILGLSGVAVVALPEPEYGPDGEGQYGFRSPVSSVSVTPGGRVWDEDFDMTADEARDHAACLLAAGVFSEGATND